MRFIFYTLLFFPILVKMVFSFNEYPVGLYKHFGTQHSKPPFVYQSRAIKNGTQQPEKPVVYQSAKINHIAAIVYPAATSVYFVSSLLFLTNLMKTMIITTETKVRRKGTNTRLSFNASNSSERLKSYASHFFYVCIVPQESLCYNNRINAKEELP